MSIIDQVRSALGVERVYDHRDRCVTCGGPVTPDQNRYVWREDRGGVIYKLAEHNRCPKP